MFRFGLRKEEQEILTRTITELQELRSDLAHLKSALAVLNIENVESECPEPESLAESLLERTETPVVPEPENLEALSKEEMASPSSAPAESLPSENEGNNEPPIREERVSEAEITQELNPNHGQPVSLSENQETEQSSQKSETKENALESADDQRDWAVVHFCRTTKRWWNGWPFEKRASKRVI